MSTRSSPSARTLTACSSIGLLLALVACNTRTSETPPASETAAGGETGTAPNATPSTAPSPDTGTTPGTAATPTQGSEEAAAEAGPPVTISWRLVPTRTEGALVIAQASGTSAEVFSAELPLDCTSAKPARGALLTAECTGAGATVRISARQVRQEIEIASMAGAGKKAEVLKRIALPAGVRTARAQTSPTDAAKAGEVLVGWSFTPYRDVHVRVERTEPVPASVEQFVAELAGCPAEAPPPTQEVKQAALVCQHRGQTATLSARRQPGIVAVAHTVSGEGLEQHQVEELVIALPASDTAAGAH
jgi:hypothetical protein